MNSGSRPPDGNLAPQADAGPRDGQVLEAGPPAQGSPFEPEAPVIDASLTWRLARGRWLKFFDHRYFSLLLARHSGNVSAVARVARIDRIHLYRLLKRCGLR
jgi:DNA-binding NtrC family response regulator